MNTIAKSIVLVTSSLRDQYMAMTDSKSMEAFRKADYVEIAQYWHDRKDDDVDSHIQENLFIDVVTYESFLPSWLDLEGKLIVVDEVDCGKRFFTKSFSNEGVLPYVNCGRVLILDVKNGYQYVPYYMLSKDLDVLEKLCQMDQYRIVDGVSYGEYRTI